MSIYLTANKIMVENQVDTGIVKRLIDCTDSVRESPFEEETEHQEIMKLHGKHLITPKRQNYSTSTRLFMILLFTTCAMSFQKVEMKDVISKMMTAHQSPRLGHKH